MTNVIFMGTPAFSVPILQQLLNDGLNVIAVVTQPDRPVGRKKVLTPPPVKVEAIHHSIQVIQPDKLKGSAELEEIISLKPDLIVTAAFGQLLPAELLEAPPLGCINVHASLLPELRGGAPIHHAIIQGKKETGITIMYMAEKLDAGDIISQEKVEITDKDDVETLHSKLSETGAKLLSQTIPLLLDKTAVRIPQDHSKATFAWNIKREEERIDWEKSGEEIYNQIRGLNPWPVAYTIYNGKPLKVYKAEKIEKRHDFPPGVIIEKTDQGPVISSGSGQSLLLTVLQPFGKKKMDASDFLRGAGSDMKIGEKVGNLDE
ncbi:methionyl-tRNA formyltransferase [Jeotgalibacillus proteolyticus]|uniref:Methionyl-tRNA formyltransferase n=1 Tax=Jeotgalibacillus proteolyticus TaxID=2082395 RepID=A0A2S5GGD9_9BACL|nr:methionyl-tRNA formyltransferase [Jeotgalibacillus proteolyticus]PPA72102.1 methionyl-tRNA formyltransferase [Jeotgalibacillus proteolyticus]